MRKHVAATCYLLGKQLDDDPFLLFRLRGRGQDEPREGLRRRADETAGSVGAAREAADGVATQTGGEDPAAGTTGRDPGHGIDDASTRPAATPLVAYGFWTAAEEPPGIDLPAERPDRSLLRRLGPFAALDDDLLTCLGPRDRAVAAAAGKALEVNDATAADIPSAQRGGDEPAQASPCPLTPAASQPPPRPPAAAPT